MSDLPAARITHFTSRRLRMRVPEKRRDAVFFGLVADHLADWDSVERVETNPLTGSILIYFTDAHRLLAEAAAKNDLLEIDFDGIATGPTEPVVTRAAVRSLETADMALRRWTQNQLDVRSALFLLLLAGGTYQLLRRRLAAPAPTLLWYAGDLIGLWNHLPANAAAESGPGPASG
jgi:Heavy metal associated domain 2